MGRARRRSGWWKSVVGMVDGREGNWFWDNLVLKLGDGRVAPFWDGMWNENRPLKD